MESITSSDRKRFLTGILLGIGMLILAGLVSALTLLMVSVGVFGCVESPPETKSNLDDFYASCRLLLSCLFFLFSF